MVQDGAGGGGSVAPAAVAEGTDKHFVDSSNKHLLKGLVGAIILVEDGGGNVMGLAKVGDLGTRRNRWDGGIGARVDRSDEGCGQECYVHGQRDIEL